MIKLGDVLKECDECQRMQGIDYNHGQSHQARMAKAELRSLISNASKLEMQIHPEDELPGWVAAYVTLASDYIHSVEEFMAEQSAEMSEPQQAPTPGYAVYENKNKYKK